MSAGILKARQKTDKKRALDQDEDKKGHAGF
jgi:hypothetical protein